jgi:hypothetical protein
MLLLGVSVHGATGVVRAASTTLLLRLDNQVAGRWLDCRGTLEEQVLPSPQVLLRALKNAALLENQTAKLQFVAQFSAQEYWFKVACAKSRGLLLRCFRS